MKIAKYMVCFRENFDNGFHQSGVPISDNHLSMLHFEVKRPTNILSVQMKLFSFSKERKANTTEYVNLVEVTPTISNNGIW